MDALVSIVLPIYNVEKYLERCILSVINQTYHNLEIILVDDGSTDNSPRICDEYAAKDPRVKVIHKQNAGAGMARNTGIENATGRYICFFDSDDYIESDTIETCIAIVGQYNTDLVVFGYDNVTNSGEIISTQVPCAPKNLFSGEEITKVLLPMSICSNQKSGEDWKIPLSPCNKFYSMSAIEKTGWRFVSEREFFSEDYYSLTELHKNLNSVFVLDRVFYHYVENNSSLSRTFKADRFERVKEFYKSMISLGEAMNLESVLDQPIKSLIFGFSIGAMKHTVSSDLSFRHRYSELKRIIKDELLQELIRTTNYTDAGLQKKLLYKAAAYKFTWFCFILIYLKNKKDAKKQG